nr:TPA_asm: polymerase PB2 [Diachasmavirus orthomyxi]
MLFALAFFILFISNNNPFNKMETDNTNKSVLMLLINKIKKANAKSIAILRNNPMSNLKLIERSSKCIKDPNPLNSMMMTINTKYPITVNADKARNYGVPDEFLCPGKKGEDVHYHGRQLCKLSTINWWLENSKKVEDDTKLTVDILYKQVRKDVNNYYNLNWEASRVQFGVVNLERKLVNTRNPDIVVPRNLIKPLLMQTLMPDHTIPFDDIPSHIKGEFSDMIKQTPLEKINLCTQLRVLQGSLDEKKRVLPVQPGISEQMAQFSYAMRQNNIALSGLHWKREPKHLDFTRPITELSRVTLYELRENKTDFKDVIKSVKTMTLKQIPIIQIIKTSKYDENTDVKWLKTALGFPISAEFTKDGFTTSPHESSVRVHMLRNRKGVTVKGYLGNEKVSFKYGDVRGVFVHSMSQVTSIIMNHVTRSDLLECLIRIAQYVRYNFEFTNSTTLRGAFQEIRSIILEKPEHFIMTEPEKLPHMYRGIEGTYGYLIIRNSIEYEPGSTKYFTLDGNYNIANPRSSQIIEAVTPLSVKPLSNDFDCEESPMISYLGFKKYVMRKFFFFYKNISQVYERVISDDYKWKNERTSTFSSDCASLSFRVRSILKSLCLQETQQPEEVAYLYIFAHPDPIPIAAPGLSLFGGSFIFDLTMSSGMFSYDDRIKQYTLFNIPVGQLVENQPEKCHTSLNYLLNGYKLIPPNDNYPVKSVNYLREKMDKINDGEPFVTYISDKKLGVRRSRYAELNIHETLTRQLNVNRVWKEESDSVLHLLRKRKGTEEEGEKAAKIQRTQEEEKEMEEADDEMIGAADAILFDD